MSVPTLALDLASTTGWAVRDAAGRLHSGAWKLDLDGREFSLWSRVLDTYTAHNLRRVVIESPIVYPGRPSGARVSFGLRGVVCLFAQSMALGFDELAPSAAKYAATGKGNADKATVLENVRRLFPNQKIGGHDQADALAVLYAFERGAKVNR